MVGFGCSFSLLSILFHQYSSGILFFILSCSVSLLLLLDKDHMLRLLLIGVKTFGVLGIFSSLFTIVYFYCANVRGILVLRTVLQLCCFHGNQESHSIALECCGSGPVFWKSLSLEGQVPQVLLCVSPVSAWTCSEKHLS